MTNTPNLLKSGEWYASYGWHVIPLHEPLFNAVDCHGKPTKCSCEDFWRYSGTKKKPADPDFECDSAGKHPRISQWETRATTDVALIRKWWDRWPTANIGVACGPSGIVCVDLDTYNALAESGNLPLTEKETITSLTGGGGEHLIYQHPPDGPLISFHCDLN